MVALFDTYSLERALSVPTDPKLRQLLTDHLGHLQSVDRAVSDATYFLIIDAGTTLDEVADELGWSPLIDLDGNRYGEDAYAPFHDYLEDRGGWFVAMTSAGNDAVFVLIVQDHDGVESALLDYCRTYAGDSACG